MYEINNQDLIILKLNSSYVIGNNENGLCVFKLCPNLPLISIEAEYGSTDIVELHPTFKNVFLTINLIEMVIWEINENKNKCEKKILLKKNLSKPAFVKIMISSLLLFQVIEQ